MKLRCFIFMNYVNNQQKGVLKLWNMINEMNFHGFF